ncbi:FeoA family protein [Maridesulfovibrio ferrireducens]|uniref:FeoA family protein n=1 Tax=Maridesulfovibrio ferrireducens TaxID=246191 RepID=UPI001A3535B3|nr:FeoA family protein [Maridesulfovibrio ferrireducens]MBI9112772.1 ferrous iron transport protein A [Maridesulfovibrio ferrireducens]
MFNKFDFLNGGISSGKREQRRRHGGRGGPGKKCIMRGKSVLDIAVGGKAKIRRHFSCGAVRQRLLDLGFIPGREVEVIRVATLGCPLELKVAGYCVTLRRTEAYEIEVEDEFRG